MKSVTLTLAAVLAAGTVAPAAAQSYDPRYDREVSNYENRASDYASDDAAYRARRDAYERDWARYQEERRLYDARWGVGAYERRYGVFRGYAYDDGYRGYSTTTYDSYRNSPCERRRGNNRTAGTIIGALAGAAIGSNVAARGVRTEGAVLGAVVGGLVGNQIGKSTARCDSNGYYYTRAETYPYNEGGYYSGRRSGRYYYNDYNRRGCRLAIAPVGSEYRYVRVCPDRRGRYRIAD